MTKFSYIEPEVAGGLGGRTRFDRSVRPPIVHQLEYRFSGWLGGDIVASHPCHIVTRRLRQAIDAALLSGVTFHDMIVSVHRQMFRMLHPGFNFRPSIG